ncbi:MarR family winged helix-turn-helix transcriptional regulator [Ferrimicrobium sp.]|uniref:MarR family winged helix-turn-helix transcriptional regulator n=1 Tax=Ferrimicrobium sp. TaxID=2926050 RepID=UPI0026322A82|nr:MarR family winged helix-turn-helix transcriptional regulator [Ferrimicrobium sp.]
MTNRDREELRPFGESVAFMLSFLGAMETQSFRSLMTSLSLEPRSFGVLRVLAEVGSLTQHRLAERAHVPASTLVAMLDDLEANGLIARSPHPGDRRAHQVRLTTQGREVVDRATVLAWRHEEAVTAGFSPVERQQLLAALSRILQNLNEQSHEQSQ